MTMAYPYYTATRWKVDPFVCYCCPPSLARAIAKVHGWAYNVSAEGLWVNVYGSNALTTQLADGSSLKLIQKTDYPWNGRITIILQEAKANAFSIMLRIPGWCQGAQLWVNGIQETLTVNKGYARLNRAWKSGDQIILHLPLNIQLIESHPNIAENRGRVALQRGPVVYAFEALDNGGNSDITLLQQPKFILAPSPLWKNVTLIIGKTQEGNDFTAIPIFAVANRGETSRHVWVRLQGKTDNTSGWTDLLYRTYFTQSGCINRLCQSNSPYIMFHIGEKRDY
jgi:DUF1680 family protein